MPIFLEDIMDKDAINLIETSPPWLEAPDGLKRCLKAKGVFSTLAVANPVRLSFEKTCAKTYGPAIHEFAKLSMSPSIAVTESSHGNFVVFILSLNNAA